MANLKVTRAKRLRYLDARLEGMTAILSYLLREKRRAGRAKRKGGA